jgi:hypothetical protein
MNDDEIDINDELKNITLTTKEGWAKLVHATPRMPPNRLSSKKIKALSAADTRRYTRRRNDWHANLGVIMTPQLLSLHEELAVIIDSNVQDGNKVKGGVAVEGMPGVGKTTAVELFAKEFHLSEIADNGPMTDSGHERWPVCRITLNGTPTPRALYVAMLHFLAHPAVRKGNADDFSRRALNVFCDCNVRLLIIDEVHFTAFDRADGVKLSNHFKSIANDFDVTTIFVGIGLTEAGFFSEGSGKSLQHAIKAQTARRTTGLTMERFNAEPMDGRRQWRRLIWLLEKKLVLADHECGTLAAGPMSDYLYERTQGYIQSLTTLLTRGCTLAIRNGAEALTVDVLERVKIDVAAESGREAQRAALRVIREKQARRTGTPQASGLVSH